MADSLRPHGLYSPWNFPSQNTGVGSLSLLQGIFPTQGLNPGLPHYRRILYQLSHKGSPRVLEWVAYPFSRGSSQSRARTKVSYIAGRFFTSWATKEAPVAYSLNTACVPAKSLQLCPTLQPYRWTVARRAPPSVGFSRQEYWSGLPCPKDLPDPGMEPVPLTSPALIGWFFTPSATWEALLTAYCFPKPKVLTFKREKGSKCLVLGEHSSPERSKNAVL